MRPPDDNQILSTEGVTIRLRRDEMFGSLWRQGKYEILATKIFRLILQEGDTVVDAGANFGWYTSQFANWVGSVGLVHAFEPINAFSDMVDENAKLSGVADRVRLHRVGLGAVEGTFTVFTFPGLPIGHASASDLGRADAEPHLCSVTTLDAALRETPVQFLKIDTEGYELEILQGGSSLLGRDDAPVIYFETNKECLNRRGIASSRLIDTLRAAGYDRFVSFSVRHGFVEVEDFASTEDGDHLAFKRGSHLARMDRVLSTSCRWN